MSEIKFRAWDVECKDMLEGVVPISNKEIIIVRPFTRDLTLKPATVMQFTGLQDKTGKDIYEGDIIHLTTTYCRVELEHTAEVVFESGAFILGANTICDSYMTFIEAGDEWELDVVGNIYENKELLSDNPGLIK